jgi:hypothetical protein
MSRRFQQSSAMAAQPDASDLTSMFERDAPAISQNFFVAKV